MKIFFQVFFVFYLVSLTACRHDMNDELRAAACDEQIVINEQFPLERSHEIPNFHEVKMAGDFIIISPFNSPLLFFYKRDGQLHHKINQAGGGPGDFGNNMISADVAERKLYIHDTENSRYTALEMDDFNTETDLINHIEIDFPGINHHIVRASDHDTYPEMYERTRNDVTYKLTRYSTDAGSGMNEEVLYSSEVNTFVVLEEPNFTYISNILNDVSSVSHSGRIYLFDTARQAVMSLNSDRGEWDEIFIETNWTPDYETIIEYETEQITSSQMSREIRTYLNLSVRENSEHLSWFHDVLLKGDSFYFSLLPGSDMKAAYRYVNPVEDESKLLCTDRMWDPYNFMLIDKSDDTFTFLEIDENHEAVIAIGRFL